MASSENQIPGSLGVMQERLANIMTSRQEKNLSQVEVNALAEEMAGVGLGQGPVVGSTPATNKRRENTGDSR